MEIKHDSVIFHLLLRCLYSEENKGGKLRQHGQQIYAAMLDLFDVIYQKFVSARIAVKCMGIYSRPLKPRASRSIQKNRFLLD